MSSATSRSTWRRTDGASAVEFGLLLPLLLVILLGTIDYGYVYFANLTMTNAAREGARVGVTRDAASASAAATAAATAYLDSAGLRTNLTATATTPSSGDPAVTVVVTMEPFSPLIGFVPVPGRLQTSATMRWELAPLQTAGL